MAESWTSHVGKTLRSFSLLPDDNPGSDNPSGLGVISNSYRWLTGWLTEGSSFNNAQPCREEFDYVHFATFLGLKEIKFFSPQDVGLYSSPDVSQSGKGLSMDVTINRCPAGPLQGQLVALKKARDPNDQSNTPPRPH
ncbi:hypothetical protein FGG08_004510 [Glutinoglossum americanum]|uniref:Uncharacterized protein n=1 Tax=Glutinoglossum americanum TaxID=1670608 RepID=A0A9P8L3V4_9PEZI|nr:hypothetical protein FGG08_004510 [Glutinoglossum americanum]